MSLIATTLSHGLSTYAASLWVKNLHSAMETLLPHDKGNIIHTILYASFLTVMIVIFVWIVEKYLHRNDKK